MSRPTSRFSEATSGGRTWAWTRAPSRARCEAVSAARGHLPVDPRPCGGARGNGERRCGEKTPYYILFAEHIASCSPRHGSSSSTGTRATWRRPTSSSTGCREGRRCGWRTTCCTCFAASSRRRSSSGRSGSAASSTRTSWIIRNASFAGCATSSARTTIRRCSSTPSARTQDTWRWRKFGRA